MPMKQIESIPGENNLFAPDEALALGTLFPTFYHPIPGKNNKHEIKDYDLSPYAAPFAAWEMRLHLDTHPKDRNALAMYHKFCEQSPKGYATLACALYGVRQDACPLEWNWIDSPWPWEKRCLKAQKEG